MSDSHRNCSNCKFFTKAPINKNGWCTHPKRQQATDLKLLVRERELACRNSWGDDLWAAAELSHATTSPARSHRGLPIRASQADDQITSVISAKVTASEPAAASEDVVTHTAVRREASPSTPFSPRDYDHNAGANADQDERARVMARGPRNAISSARQRHIQRRHTQRPMIEPDKVPAADPPVADTMEQTRARIHEGGIPYPVTPPVPKEEVVGRSSVVSPVSGPDARFDSVPEVRSEVDLPRLREFLSGSAPAKGSASSPYDLVLQRAQEFKDSSTEQPNIHVSQRHRMYRPVEPAPIAPEADERGNGDEVVWDVGATALTVVFERARNAVTSAKPAPVANHLDEEDRVTNGATQEPLLDEQTIVPVGPAPSTEHLNDEFIGMEPVASLAYQEDPADSDVFVRQDAYWETNEQDRDPEGDAFYGTAEDEPLEVFADAVPDRHSPMAYGEEQRSSEFDSGLHAYDAADDDDAALERSAFTVSERQAESPRTSWWRSLNFNLKRRYQPSPETAPAYDGINTAASWTEEEPGNNAYDTRPLDVWDEDDDWDQTDEVWHDQGASAGDHGPIGNDPAPTLTSEDNWLADEYLFPAPQPSAWHEERARILQSRPLPEPLPEPVVFAGDEDRVQVAHDGLPARVPRRREPVDYFERDDADGLSAFRAALFAASSQEMHAERHAPLRATSYAPVRSSNTDELDGPDDDGPGRAPVPPRRETREPSHTYQRYATGREMFDPTFDLEDALETEDDAPRQFEVASRVHKACMTCRSFQSSQDGTQGRCSNEWAPTHRQMVNADDVACRSSIGDWWLAADASWIPPTDRIVPETPRTDRLAARGQRRNSTSQPLGRRVRTRKVV